jgi:transcriptional regulator with XRE-family HTH domain
MSDLIFSARLRSLRGTRTKAEFARFLGVPPPMYHRYELGQVPKSSNLKVIADRCGVTIDALIGINPDDQLHPGQAAPAPPPATLALAPPATPQPCRYPADCDLDKRLSAMETDLATMRIQNDTLIRLLGGTLAAQHVAGGEKKKAG